MRESSLGTGEALGDLLVLAASFSEGLVNSLVLGEWQMLTQFLETTCQILRAVHHFVGLSDADILRVDMAEHMSIAVALDRDRTVDFDMALAIVINGLDAINLLRLDQEEGDGAPLVLKANVHSLLEHSLSDRALDFLVTLNQTFDLHSLLGHCLQLLHLSLHSLVHSHDLGLLGHVFLDQLCVFWGNFSFLSKFFTFDHLFKLAVSFGTSLV